MTLFRSAFPRRRKSNMYESDDPRSRLATASTAKLASAAFGTATYARFHGEPPQMEDARQKSWYVRGQNFVVAYSEAEGGTVFERRGQADEYEIGRAHV